MVVPGSRAMLAWWRRRIAGFVRPAEDAVAKSQQSAAVVPAMGKGWVPKPTVILALLFLSYATSIMDRMIFSVVANDVGHEMSLSDTTLGVLLGPAFSIVYSTMWIMLWIQTRRYQLGASAVCIMHVGFHSWTGPSQSHALPISHLKEALYSRLQSRCGAS